MRRPSGFTLVELVTVMVILGILAIGTVSFIADSSRGYASTVVRTQLATEARFLAERLARHVRDALPNSVRVAGACVELIPIEGASHYTTIPVVTASATFRSIPFDPLPGAEVVRAAVFPDINVYALGSPASVSPPVALSVPDANNEITVTMAAPHRFVSESPKQRYFLVGDPMSYCIDGNRMWHYTGYGYQPVQPGAATLPGAMPGRVLVGQDVTSITPFALNDATLARNAVLEIDFELARDGERVRVEHIVQVRNVP